MATLIHLDTHVLVWLYLARLDLLSPTARQFLDQRELVISPMVLIELELLQEIGRLQVGAQDVFGSLQAQIGLRLADEAFPVVVEAAKAQRWTRDPFDRLIVGQAVAGGSELLTRDDTIRQNLPAAIW